MAFYVSGMCGTPSLHGCLWMQVPKWCHVTGANMTRYCATLFKLSPEIDLIFFTFLPYQSMRYCSMLHCNVTDFGTLSIRVRSWHVSQRHDTVPGCFTQHSLKHACTHADKFIEFLRTHCTVWSLYINSNPSRIIKLDSLASYKWGTVTVLLVSAVVVFP